jgi:hypothetical protein
VNDLIHTCGPDCLRSACVAAREAEAKAIIERLTASLEALKDLTADAAEQLRQERDEAQQEAREWRKQHHELKAQRVDVEAVMRLADEYASVPYGLDNVRAEAAREALRAAVEGRTAK